MYYFVFIYSFIKEKNNIVLRKFFIPYTPHSREFYSNGEIIFPSIKQGELLYKLSIYLLCCKRYNFISAKAFISYSIPCLHSFKLLKNIFPLMKREKCKLFILIFLVGNYSFSYDIIFHKIPFLYRLLPPFKRRKYFFYHQKAKNSDVFPSVIY